jgi:aryl-alcohol dehydrogenase-like predicted oxidoreductase
MTITGRDHDRLGRFAEDLGEPAGLLPQGIAFLPWFPLGAGKLAEAGGALVDIARRHHATPAQVALAWLPRRSPVMLPIPGTSSVAHLEENLAASTLRLADDEFHLLGSVGIP